MSTSSDPCRQCGKPLPPGFPLRVCADCLVGLAECPDSPGRDPAKSSLAPSGFAPLSATRAPAPPSPESLQALFPELEIQTMLGAGGMGAVYRATQRNLDREVALKLMIAAPEDRDEFALRFEREARLLAKLKHPGIVAIYDYGRIPGTPTEAWSEGIFYLIMEFVDGSDVGQLIRSGDLPPLQALELAAQCCDGLGYAHASGITHRDIKPSNLLVDREGRIRIADFGLAKIAGDESGPDDLTLTSTGLRMGSPCYMAPEQWDCPGLVDHRSDLYSLGAVLYEMLTGERPLGKVDPPSSRVAVDPRVDRVVLKALERDPTRRYQQAEELKEAILRISAHPRGWRRRPRHAATWLGISVALPGALLATLFLLRPGDGHPGGASPATTEVASTPDTAGAIHAPSLVVVTGPSTEAAPASEAAVDLVALRKRGGRLRTWSLFESNSLEVEMVSAFDDFVRAEIGSPHPVWRPWIAMRSNRIWRGHFRQADGQTGWATFAGGVAITWEGNAIPTNPSVSGASLARIPKGKAVEVLHGDFLGNSWHVLLDREGRLHPIPSPAQIGHALPMWEEFAAALEALEGVVAIRGALAFGMALKRDGSLLCWDLRTRGGTLFALDDPLPTPVEIACGQGHYLARNEEGEVRHWNFRGERLEIPVPLPRVVAIRANVGRTIAAAAQLENARWIAWGESEALPVLERIPAIGPAVDLSFDTSPHQSPPTARLIWIEPRET